MRRFATAWLLALAALFVSSASASTLGGVASRRLFSDELPARPVTLLASFTVQNNTPITTGTALDYGGTWTVHAGSWSVASGQAQCGSNPACNVLSTISVDAGRRYGSASVALDVSNGLATRSGGVVLDRSAAGDFLVALYRNVLPGGEVALLKVVGGVSTTLATASTTGRPTAASLRVTRSGATVTVELNGTTYVTHSLSAGDQAVFGANATRWGIALDSDRNTRVDDFLMVG